MAGTGPTLQKRLERRTCAQAGTTEDRGVVGAGAEVTEAGYKPDMCLHGSRWHANSPGTIEGFTRTSATCGRTPAWCREYRQLASMISSRRTLGRAGQGLRGLARKPGVFGQGSRLRTRTEVLNGAPDVEARPEGGGGASGRGMPAPGARSQQCNVGLASPQEIGSRHHQMDGRGRGGRRGVWTLSLLRRAIRGFGEETPKKNQKMFWLR